MRSTAKPYLPWEIGLLVLTALCVCGFTRDVDAQRIAFLTPDRAELGERIRDGIGEELSSKYKVLDQSLVETAYSSVLPEDPFNLSQTDAQNIGARVGCDFLVVLRAAIEQRSTARSNDYYKGFIPVYVVSTRTGRLEFWRLIIFNAASPAHLEEETKRLMKVVATDVHDVIVRVSKGQPTEPSRPAVEEVPDSDSPLAKNFKPPIPYRRIKPEYTPEAAAFNITATVEILVDIAADGRVTRTEIVRYAGFDLDQSVEKAVRRMQWRAAERDGKFIPMRVLLRYNFKKIDKE